MNEVLSLVIAHRAVLLYAQSGAGKTSLLNAGLIPLLQDEGFDVLLPRVGSIPRNISVGQITNTYTFNALLSLAKGEGIMGRSDIKHLTQISLSDYLEGQERLSDVEMASTPLVLIFDQFEELFTLQAKRREEREEFFKQLQDALNNDRILRVIFVVREDYIAWFDPYVRFLPEKLRVRFRLEHLREEAALSAITGPLKGTGYSFAESVAERLVYDLLKIQSQISEDDSEPVIGEYVEPVQLQIVCHRLWNDLPPGVMIITLDYLQELGDVNKALMDYYESAISSVVRSLKEERDLFERDLREWFERSLITVAGTRGSVFQDQNETDGIPNTVVDVLEDLHVIRGVQRSGARWFELTHDRFIAPIQQSNQQSFPKLSSLWTSQKDEAERRRRYRRQRWRRIVVLIVGVVSIIIFIVRNTQQPDLRQHQVNLVRSLIAQAQQVMLDGESGQSLLLAVESRNISSQVDETRALIIEDVLWQALVSSGWPGLQEHEGAINVVDISPDGHWLITGSDDSTARLWNLEATDPTESSVVLRGHTGSVVALAISPDSRWLITGSTDHTARLWDLRSSDLARTSTILVEYDSPIVAVAIRRNNSESRWFAMGGDDGVVRVMSFDDADPDTSVRLVGSYDHSERISVVEFSLDNRWLVAGSSDSTVLLWSIDDEDKLPTPVPLAGHEGPILTAAISDNNRWLVTGSADTTARLWELKDPVETPIVLRGLDWALFYPSRSAPTVNY